MNEFVSFIANFGYWNWFILALILLVLELLVPGIYFLWLGAAALIVGGLMVFIDVGWQSQVALFAVLSIATVVLSRFILNKPGMEESDQPHLNRRLEKMIGEVTVLSEAIAAGRGRVRIGDSSWIVRGPDLPKGARVKITGAEGALLEVEPAD